MKCDHFKHYLKGVNPPCLVDGKKYEDFYYCDIRSSHQFTGELAIPIVVTEKCKIDCPCFTNIQEERKAKIKKLKF